MNPLLSVAVDGAPCVSSSGPAAYPLCWRPPNVLPSWAIAFDRTPPNSADDEISNSEDDEDEDWEDWEDDEDEDWEDDEDEDWEDEDEDEDEGGAW